MSEHEDPLSSAHRALLSQRRDLEPPPGFEDALLARLHTSMAAAPAPAPVTPPSSPTGSASTAVVSGVGVSALVVGVALGAVAGHAWWPGPTPDPVIVERVKTVEVVREVERPTTATPPKRIEAKPTVAPVDPSPDALLAEERQLIDVARSALLHGDPRAALESLNSHAKRFPSGRLAEERASLEVQALVLAGRPAEARQVAEAFHRQFPHSLLGPVVDAALSPE